MQQVHSSIPTQTVYVSVISESKNLAEDTIPFANKQLQLTVQPCEGADCDTVIHNVLNSEGKITDIFELFGTSELIFELTPEASKDYRLEAMSSVSNVTRTGVSDASNLALPSWELELTSAFEEFVTSNLDPDGNRLSFTCKSQPPEGTQHACGFNLNVVPRQDHRVAVIDPNTPPSLLLLTICHDPIIIVGKPK